MVTLNIPKIQEVDKAHWQKIQEKFDNLIKPVGSLARLEDITCLYAAAQGLDEVDYPDKTLLLFVGSHGISEFYQEAGIQAAEAFKNQLLAEQSAINILADSFKAKVETVFIEQKLGAADNIIKKEAMNEKQFKAAFELGRETAEKAVQNGAKILGLGCFAPGAALGYTLIIMSYFKLSLSEMNQDNDVTVDKLFAEILAKHKSFLQKAPDFLALMMRFGGYELAAMTGALLQAASMNVPVFLDGLASLIAARLASDLSPAVREYLVPVATTTEKGQNILLTEMMLSTMLDLKLSLPAGEASLFGFNLLDAGIKALREMDSFGHVHFPLGDIK